MAAVWRSCIDRKAGSQIEILGYNYQKMICIEELDNKLTNFIIYLIVSSVSI